MTKTYAIVDTDTGKLIQVTTEQPGTASTSRILTKLAFMRRLTDTELATILAMVDTQPLAKVWMEKYRLADEINLDDPEIQAGIKTFEDLGILAEGRSVEVLG